MRRGAGGAGALLIAVAVAGGEAEACSRPQCPSEYLLPMQSTEAVAVPANLPAFGWFPAAGTRTPTAADLSFRRVDGAAMDVPFALESAPPGAVASGRWLLRPLEPLAAGASYELTAARFCTVGGTSPTTRVTAGPAAALPMTLGRITVGALVEADTYRPPDSFDGSCASPVRDAHRTLALTWDPATSPWQSLILVQLYVDGEPRDLRESGFPHPSASAAWRAQPQDDAYTICRGSSAAVAAGLTEGVHRFQYRGRVLGSDTVLSSNVVEAELHCGVADGEGGVGCAARPGGHRPLGTLVSVAALSLAFCLRRRRGACPS